MYSLRTRFCYCVENGLSRMVRRAFLRRDCPDCHPRIRLRHRP